MYFTDRGIEELERRRGDEEVTLAWLAEQLQTFVDVHPEFETAVERLATWLARLDEPEDSARPCAGGAAGAESARAELHLGHRRVRRQVDDRHDRLRHGLGPDPGGLVVVLALLPVHLLLHRRGRPAREDAGHPDPIGALLEPQGVRQRAEAELRGGVRRPAGVGPQAGARVDED